MNHNLSTALYRVVSDIATNEEFDVLDHKDILAISAKLNDVISDKINGSFVYYGKESTIRYDDKETEYSSFRGAQVEYYAKKLIEDRVQEIWIKSNSVRLRSASY